MISIILADNQAIFRAGAARVLALENDVRIVAQCEDLARAISALEAHRGALLLFASSLLSDSAEIVARARTAGCKPILVAENGADPSEDVLRTLDGLIFRNVTGHDLVGCIRHVSAGERYVPLSNLRSIDAQDAVGARVRDRLTPKELQIVALIIQGYKNRQIADELNTKEQVIKNYLRSIYDKSGVSDRLELALFTIHHRVLADAASRVSDLKQARLA